LSEAKAVMVELETQMKRLTALHKENVERADLFDDGSKQEHVIEIATAQITQSFHRCQKLVIAIDRKSQMLEFSEMDKKLGKNAASATARDLQDLSMTFRKSQSVRCSFFYERGSLEECYLDPRLLRMKPSIRVI
jgi:hypothetical protein